MPHSPAPGLPRHREWLVRGSRPRLSLLHRAGPDRDLNSDGNTDTTSLNLDPATETVSFESDPAGIDLLVGDTVKTAPFSRTMIQGSTAFVSAPASQTVNGTTYRFLGWSRAPRITR